MSSTPALSPQEYSKGGTHFDAFDEYDAFSSEVWHDDGFTLDAHEGLNEREKGAIVTDWLGEGKSQEGTSIPDEIFMSDLSVLKNDISKRQVALQGFLQRIKQTKMIVSTEEEIHKDQIRAKNQVKQDIFTAKARVTSMMEKIRGSSLKVNEDTHATFSGRGFPAIDHAITSNHLSLQHSHDPTRNEVSHTYCGTTIHFSSH